MHLVNVIDNSHTHTHTTKLHSLPLHSFTGVKSTSFCCHSSRYSSIAAPLPAGADHEMCAMWGDLQTTVGNVGASGIFGRVDMSTTSDHGPSYSQQSQPQTK